MVPGRIRTITGKVTNARRTLRRSRKAALEQFGGDPQLLGEILLHRANVKAMMRYVSEVDNLKLMMVLLKDQSRSIQFEAFHVFKARRCPRRRS